MFKISFIIPVYNVEKYLEQCVKSIINQTYKNIEIILVNDGSTDNSPKICEQLKKEDERILVLHKKNGGLSETRNLGLTHASGDYVVFIDSDDYWISESSLEALEKHLEENKPCDFIGFNCSYFYQHSKRYTKWTPYDKKLEKKISGDKALPILVSSGTVPMSACLKIIRRRLLIEKEILFKQGIISEDIPWFINLLEQAKNCLFINDYIYAYRQNVTGSITKSKADKIYNSLIYIINNEINLLEKREFSRESKNALLSFLAYELSIILGYYQDLPKKIKREARSEIKAKAWLLNYKQNPKVSKISKLYRFLGFQLTTLTLKFYLWLKKRKN